MKRARPLVALCAAACFISLSLLGACGDDNSRQPQSDNEAIAMVEQAQRAEPPVQPVKLESITAADASANHLFGAGCAFLGNDGREPLVMSNSERAVIKLAGRMVVLASDPGGRSMPLGSWARYVGKIHTIALDREGGKGTVSGEEASQWAASLTVRDPQDRIVYSATGKLECGT